MKTICKCGHELAEHDGFGWMSYVKKDAENECYCKLCACRSYEPDEKGEGLQELIQHERNK